MEIRGLTDGVYLILAILILGTNLWISTRVGRR